MIHIALVDDHEMFREGLKSIFSQKNDIEVVLESSNGKSFLESYNNDINVVIMDLDMPEYNGLQTMENLQNNHPDAKVVFLSQNREASSICRLMELGAKGYLTKDVKPEELLNAIYSVQETGFYFNDLVSQSMLVKLAGKQHINPLFNQSEALSERELEVLQLICEELTTAEIGERLFLSPKTIENHRSNILSKTGARNSAGLVVYAIKNKLIHVG